MFLKCESSPNWQHQNTIFIFGVDHLLFSNIDLPKKVGSDLLGYEHCGCSMGLHEIWRSPYYNFIIPNRKGKKCFKQIVFQVTKSAPYMIETKGKLSEVLNDVLAEIPKNGIVMDFGAGKLRNTIYLMQQGYDVLSVEFDMKTKYSGILNKYANRFRKKFKKLIQPHDFITDKTKVDLIILINVTTTMPIPSERLLVLKYCREHLKNDGFIFWFTQHNDKHMYDGVDKVEQAIGDGHYKNIDDKFQTFHHEFTNEEIDYMCLSNGLRFVESYPAGGPQARLYHIVGTNPLDSILTSDKISQHIDSSYKDNIKNKKSGIPKLLKSKIIEPIVEELKIENLLIEALEKLPKGTDFATEYHNLTAAIFLVLFGLELKNIQIERVLKDNRHKIDIMLSNRMDDGFWGDRKKENKSKMILIDCKNYSIKIKSAEFDKFIVGLKGYGNFGIITYRKPVNGDDKKRILKHCKNMAKDETYVICLSDNELIELLNLKLNDESLDEFLQNKLDELE